MDRPDITLDRRRLIGLAGVGVAGGATWDILRSAADVEVTGPTDRPDASDEEIAAYVRGCTDFGLDLLSELVDVDATGI